MRQSHITHGRSLTIYPSFITSVMRSSVVQDADVLERVAVDHY